MAQHDTKKPDAKAPAISYFSKARAVVENDAKRLLIILALVIIALLSYGYIHTRNQLNQLSNPGAATKNETKVLVVKVGKLVELPTGENPTLATVNDATKLKSQSFFHDAANGDKVLIYSNAGKAVLYRPSSIKSSNTQP